MRRVAELAAAIDEAGRHGIGANNPPEPTPFETHALNIDNLMETAQGFLDGEPITTQAQADDVGRLLDEARKARTAADAQRKIEAKPFDDGKAAVQALWTPYTDEKKGKCALIAEVCKKALAPFLKAEQDRKDAEAAAAREAAAEAQRKAQEAIRAAEVTDLAAREQAEALLKEADKATKAADRAGKDRAHVAGGARAVSLRSVWSATLVDPMEALKHYRAVEPAQLKAFLQTLADQDVRAGMRTIPGFTITEEKVAQ
jgi:hypothetical protein